MAGGRSTERASTSESGRRIAALSIGLLGALGLTVGVASQIDSAWAGAFQAGTTLAETNCQDPNVPIVGSLSTPSFDPDADAPFSPGALQFADISPECLGHEYQVAYRTAASWELIAQGTVTGSTVTVPADDLLGAVPTEFAISFTKD